MAVLVLPAIPTAAADPLGISYYAMSAFNTRQCDRALASFDDIERPALAVLWSTFGEDTTCLKRFLRRFADRPHTLEIHSTNQTCLRSNDCTRAELTTHISRRRYTALLEKGDARLVRAYQNRFNAIARFVAENRNPNTRVIISTGLEDDFSPAAYAVVTTMLKAAKAITPFEIVRSPRSRIAHAPMLGDAALIEVHGLSGRFDPALGGRCVVNNDGADIVFSGLAAAPKLPVSEVSRFIRKYADQGCLVFLWWSGPQGLLGETGAHNPPPSERRYLVRKHEIDAVSGIARERPWDPLLSR